MADEPTTPTAENPKAPEIDPKETEDQRVPYERFQQANQKAKDAADRAKKLEADMAELRAQMEERESAGLPELERLKKDMERAQKRADEAEQRAETASREAQTQRAQGWITRSAADLFDDPEDALLRIDASEIESADDAEKAVRRLARNPKYKRLLKTEEKPLPGQVLENGRRTDPKREGEPDPMMQVIADGLRQFASRD